MVTAQSFSRCFINALNTLHCNIFTLDVEMEHLLDTSPAHTELTGTLIDRSGVVDCRTITWSQFTVRRRLQILRRLRLPPTPLHSRTQVRNVASGAKNHLRFTKFWVGWSSSKRWHCSKTRCKLGLTVKCRSSVVEKQSCSAKSKVQCGRLVFCLCWLAGSKALSWRKIDLVSGWFVIIRCQVQWRLQGPIRSSPCP